MNTQLPGFQRIQDPICLISNNLNRNKIDELKFKILSFDGVECTAFKSVEDLKYALCLNNSSEVSESNQETKDIHIKLLPHKFAKLKSALEKCNEMKKEDSMNCKTNEILRKSLEITFLDIISILQWSNKKLKFFSKPAFLDNSCPVLTGIQMRNYIAHKPALFDILNINTSMLIVCNAEKFLREFKMGSLNTGQNATIGNNIYEDAINVRIEYKRKHNIIERRPKLQMH